MHTRYKWLVSRWQFEQTSGTLNDGSRKPQRSQCEKRRLPAQMPSLPAHYPAHQVWMGGREEGTVCKNNIRKEHEVRRAHRYVCTCSALSFLACHYPVTVTNFGCLTYGWKINVTDKVMLWYTQPKLSLRKRRLTWNLLAVLYYQAKHCLCTPECSLGFQCVSCTGFT